MPSRLGEDDYRSLCAAIESSARGRDFLAEFARRNRHADTEMLVGALDRLETLMRAEGTALERLRDELRLLLIAIRLARPEIEAAGPLTKAAKLASLLNLLERRIDAMAENKPAEAAPAAEDTAPAPAPLTIVPRPDEPELPIPQPAAAAPPSIALVQAAQAASHRSATFRAALATDFRNGCGGLEQRAGKMAAGFRRRPGANHSHKADAHFGLHAGDFVVWRRTARAPYCRSPARRAAGTGRGRGAG